jgi:hypothetical protein
MDGMQTEPTGLVEAFVASRGLQVNPRLGARHKIRNQLAFDDPDLTTARNGGARDLGGGH